MFTINNYTVQDVPDLKHFEYLVVGKEIGEDGTPHIQGYGVFINRKRLAGAKKLLPRAHLEIKRGTPLEASEYCKKENDYREYGDLPRTQGERERHDWEVAYELAKKGDFSAIPKDMLIRNYHAFKRIRQDNPTPVGSLDDVCGLWFHGKTGVGKSHQARSRYPGLYDKPINKWWDGYRGEDTILLDDVDRHHMSWLGPFLKRWSDKYSFPAEHKGTTVQIRPKRIIVTSQYVLDDLIEDAKLLSALKRRFKEIPITRDMMFHNLLHYMKEFNE